VTGEAAATPRPETSGARPARVDRRPPGSIVVVPPASTVLVPEDRRNHGWDRVMYNQPAHCRRSALAGRGHAVVIDVPPRHRAQRSLAATDTLDGDPGNRTGVTRSP
jgi:hypothetical protein